MRYELMNIIDKLRELAKESEYPRNGRLSAAAYVIERELAILDRYGDLENRV